MKEDRKRRRENPFDIMMIKFENKSLDMPHHSFLNEVEATARVNVSECYQCYRCTNGCPVVHDMDITPHRIMGYIMNGERQKVLSSESIWTCLQCVTCSVRCPNGIDIAHVFETLRRLSIESGLAAKRDTWSFDELLVESVAKHGRMYELGTIMSYRLSGKNLFKDVAMGLTMIRKGRIGLVPHNIRERKQLAAIIREIRERTR